MAGDGCFSTCTLPPEATYAELHARPSVPALLSGQGLTTRAASWDVLRRLRQAGTARRGRPGWSISRRRIRARSRFPAWTTCRVRHRARARLWDGLAAAVPPRSRWLFAGT